MRIPRKGCSPKQLAYARRAFGAQGESKREIALDVGYSPNVANSVVSHIESKKGFNNAMAKLAAESNNVALCALHEFKSRGFKEFSNAELTNALSAIGTAWSKFDEGLRNQMPHNPNAQDNGKNRLRTVILQQIENQTIQPSPDVVVIPKENVLEADVVGGMEEEDVREANDAVGDGLDF